MKKYFVQECKNNFGNDEVYVSWDVYLEDKEGFEYICECPNEEFANNIADLLNQQLKNN